MAPIVVRDQVDAERWPWCLVIGLVIAIAVAVKCSNVEEGSELDRTRAACGRVRGRFPGGLRTDRSAGKRRSAAIEPWPRGSARSFPVPSTPTVMFFNEIDEGLWFYAKGFRVWHRCRKPSPVQHGL